MVVGVLTQLAAQTAAAIMYGGVELLALAHKTLLSGYLTINDALYAGSLLFPARCAVLDCIPPYRVCVTTFEPHLLPHQLSNPKPNDS
jgi:hypothetical protein